MEKIRLNCCENKDEDSICRDIFTANSYETARCKLCRFLDELLDKKQGGGKKMTELHNEALIVAEAMIKYGGFFVKSLGKVLQQADHINQQKIKNTWPEYWRKYKKFSEGEEGK